MWTFLASKIFGVENQQQQWSLHDDLVGFVCHHVNAQHTHMHITFMLAIEPFFFVCFSHYPAD